ncbi:TM2 domain containing protein [Acanthamoeba castellanii str. Neff]|uniref:TM2 domain containing protein n=1 Tax=Acanthamoeba castellanii (strain ATCC 30010 / Neff) TaxID=1257118 RepID=L8GDZ4_ACACF|nr:TM2 domain containing protein [Acanthamoeba castellanii str. Neff]ELR11320.1 TM2 domain containing protein [Acanthamoeba castellanii str. Neff]
MLESGDGGGGRCDTDQDCNNNGQCVPIGGQRGVCRCDERYAGAYCQHKRKNKLTAFLLSILLGGLAVDRFYLGYIGLGVVKLFLSVFGFVPACIANWSSTLMGWRRYTLVGDEYATIDSLDGSTGAYLCITAGNCLTCCIALGSVAWWLTDWILILKDVLHDADGHGLYDNM